MQQYATRTNRLVGRCAVLGAATATIAANALPGRAASRAEVVPCAKARQ